MCRTTHAALLLVVSLSHLASSAPAASAADWIPDPDKSSLTFTATQAGVPFEGRFKTFSADIHYDPTAPAEARVAVIVDLASVSTGAGDRDDALPGADWFDTLHHPQAVFASTGFRKTSAGHFTTNGTLTMKGIELPLVLSFTLDISGENPQDIATAKGHASLDRMAFKVGTGPFETEEIAGFAVSIAFDIQAERSE